MELGISTYAFAWAIGVGERMPREPLSAMVFLQRAKDLGLSRVQFGDNLPLHKLPNETLQQLVSFAAQEHIQVEVGAKGLYVDHIQAYLEIASQFRSPFLRIVVDDRGYEPSVEEVVDLVNGLVPELKQRNIKLAIENHDRFKAAEFVEMVVHTDPKWVGICLDTINSLGADQSIGEILPLLAPHTINFHVKDYTIHRKWHNMGFDVTGAPAGQGKMPIKNIIAALKKQGKCYSATLELWPAPLPDIEDTVQLENRWIAESLAFLKPLFSTTNAEDY
nr:TIM barrel protein [Cytophagales bacterium]